MAGLDLSLWAHQGLTLDYFTLDHAYPRCLNWTFDDTISCSGSIPRAVQAHARTSQTDKKTRLCKKLPSLCSA